MSEHHKDEHTVKTGTGYYVTASRVGNSLFLTRGDFRDNLYEVGITRSISYQNGSRFNPCVHTVASSDNGYLPASAAELTSIRWRGHAKPGEDITAMEPLPSQYIGLKPNGSTSIEVSLAELENARFDGYNRLIHLNPDRHMNALQAAMELKDTKQTLGGLLDFIKWGHEHLGRKVKIGKGLLRPLTAASKLGDVASAYLWYKFGVEPTYQDIEHLRDDLSKGKLRVKGTKPKTYAKGTVVKAFYAAHPQSPDILSAMYPNATHGSVSISQDMVHTWSGYNTWTGDILPNGVTDPFACRKVTVVGAVRGCFFAQVKNDFEIAGIDQLKDRWAWNCPSFRTLWELLPFSFLVDWVVDVGRYIERLEKRYLSVSYESHLGSIWGWEKTSTITYGPKINSLAMHWGNPVTLSRTKWAYNHNVTGSLGYYRCAHSTHFTRSVRAGLTGVNIPAISRSIKAYQITTGMALLAQLAKSFSGR